MKCIVMTLLMLAVSPLWARNSDLLKCLGQEEKRFHLKKETGPVYDLNQRLLSELIQIPYIELNQEDYRKICSGEKFSESWKLLELVLKKGKPLFITQEGAGLQKSMTEEMIDDFIIASKEVFLQFIAQIQAHSPTPQCLKEEIPELDQFFTEVKYLEADVDLRQIFEKKEEKIFDQLKNYPLAFEKCRARLKKKEKSAKASEKKS